MSRFVLYTPLKRIWQQHRLSLLSVYALNLVTALLALSIAPTAGLMINSLITSSGWGVVLFPMAYIGWQGISTLLRVRDTVVFSRIFNQLSLKLLDQQAASDIPLTKVNARIELLKQVVYFMENDFPYLMNSIVSIIGSCVLLYLYNWRLVVLSVIIIGPSVLINQRYARKIQGATKAVNDQYEQQMDVINSGEHVRQKTYFEHLRRLSIRRSTLEATNFALLEIFVFAMIFTSIYLICRTDKLDFGQIVGSYGLILRFAYGFDFIPHLTSRVATLRDVLTRIQEPLSQARLQEEGG